MIKPANKKLTNVLLILGALLLVGAVGLLVFSQASASVNADKATATFEKLVSVFPHVENAVPDDRENANMPVMQVENTDYIGVIEIPAYSARLPLRAEWNKNKISSSPMRFAGSVYNNTLIIGGSDNKGQFDFIKTITNGDSVYITDMKGSRFSYAVTKIYTTKDVSYQTLSAAEADLVLFARNTYSFEYTVILCKND